MNAECSILSRYSRHSDLISLFLASKISETHNALAQNFGERNVLDMRKYSRHSKF
jgi:hypothetical protein